MIILALESSAKVASAALTQGERLLGEFTLAGGFTHSETLLAAIDTLLSTTGVEKSAIEVYACTTGPGSFTGVRIGVSLIKGLAFGKGRCVAGVSSLLSLATGLCDREGIICPVMDARRGQLYNALFACKEGKMRRLTPDRLISAQDLCSELSERKENIYFCGDGCEIASEQIKLPNIKYVQPFLIYQSAYNTARLAEIVASEGGLIDAEELQPLYLRASSAEREREARQSAQETQKT